MKIFNANQIRKADAFTITHEPVTSLKLMERAAEACAKWLLNRFPGSVTFQIFCGTGNNGGDGLALARLLHHEGFRTHVFINKNVTQFSEDGLVNLQRVRENPGIGCHYFDELDGFQFDGNSVIIDALFGTGLNRPLEEECALLVAQLNSLQFPKISIDIPSGLLADETFLTDSEVFKADVTLSFQYWKRAFLHPETGKFTGDVHLLDIGLQKDFSENEPTENFVISEDMILKIYRPRNDFSHKGSYGSTKIISGSFGKMGAAVLAVKAALRCGSGLTTVQAPDCGYDVLQLACPEAIFVSGGSKYITAIDFAPEESKESIGIGPGLGTNDETAVALLTFLKNFERPLVADADALNILAKNAENLSLLPENSIITPHPKEFERLFGSVANSFDRLSLAREKARQYAIFIILKDHHTQIITPEGKVYYNVTGNSGMAKGGSGDALLGIITALLAQGYSSQEASIFGVWLHGKAGDLAARKFSKESMLATDLIEALGPVFMSLN
ncbi:bifunctional ADP-dependent NAD(P)H-hydrate dehydratase/NAD(P)H-hydrate epimerase [Chryseobacterium sp. 6424]|uniref:NAD(P)H-hydrate dehydratase n=1 Tax=Chryseobacterium sp. 6424 TaxID=2039166 RepID=UPI000EFC8CE3|nr:NAD(P)H-hydrate dehydratase [Chryseobacterium sp. 6424]AYO57261.1 bifunctional ADP-dependent NAD(P)H-hydrate dehydratase/NAD(P)H-hydrate epimerase [Chryseobacterium sp. 6424]